MMENPELEKKERKSWLQYVTEQSWEPELLISGLAIYATLQLPALLLDAFQYYQFNLQVGSGWIDQFLPLVIYSFLSAASYFLLVAFISHFAVRAFWVGFIGLMSVYKDGIKYDKLPYSDYFKEKAQEKLGPSERMAEKLDHISSLIFSVAFLLVLYVFGIVIMYLIFFLLFNVLKLFLPPEIFASYASTLFYGFGVLAFLFGAVTLILNLKRFRSNPRLARWQFNLSWRGSSFLMPFVYKPIQFIQLTFASNISKKNYMTSYVMLLLVLIASVYAVMFNTAIPDIFDTRSYYSANTSTRNMELEEYNSNLDEGDFIQNATLDKPSYSSNVMNVFIPYPKELDEQLNQFCEPANLPDSLNSRNRRVMINEHNIACAERFFSFTVDDSVELSGDLMFAEHPKTEQKGFTTYLNIEKQNTGRHFLKVSRVPITEEDSTEKKEGEYLNFETGIPFWVE